MLQLLKIKNIALIDNMTIEFDAGFNVFTGETGAGKSIIIDSLNFLLGARADKSLIRYGENLAKVDGVFSIDENNPYFVDFFSQLGIDFENQILISRTMSLEGRNDIRVNGEIVTLSMLRELSSNLVDIYGQNEQLILIKPKKQLALIDGFASNKLDVLNEYKNSYAQLKKINQQLNELGGDDAQRERELELLRYQIEEIEQASLTEQEELDLIEQKNKMANIEKISSLTYESENLMQMLTDNLSRCKNNIVSASTHDSELAEIADRLTSGFIEISDIFDTLKIYNSNLSFDEGEFERIDKRLDLYKNLKRKYGRTVADINNFYVNIKNKYNLLSNSDFEIEQLKKQKQQLLKVIFGLAKQVTEIRKNVAQKLEELITINLQKLGMKNASVCFKFNEYLQEERDLLADGCDIVQLYFSANKGEDLKQLKDVASGGELSRFMLAIKSIIAETDNMPTMIFDEIDTGISGLMAQAVAEQIAVISKKHQVLVITHTPQIASMADTNFLVAKFEDENRTVSNVTKLDEQGKIEEIARFFSSGASLEYAKLNATELIKQQNIFKNKI